MDTGGKLFILKLKIIQYKTLKVIYSIHFLCGICDDSYNSWQRYSTAYLKSVQDLCGCSLRGESYSTIYERDLF